MTDWIDPDDAPPLDAAWFAKAEIRKGGKVIRPRQAMPTVLQIDREAAEKFRLGKGGAYDRRVDLLSGEFAAHREQATADLVSVARQALEFAVMTLAFHGRDRGTNRQEGMLDDLEKLAIDLDKSARLALTKATTNE